MDYHHQSIRTKRGLFNFIGKVNKWFTGTLDSEDGKRYDRAIEILRNNDIATVAGYKKIVSLSQHLIDNYKKTIEIISKNQNEIKDYVNTLESRLNKIQNDLYLYFSYSTTMDKLQITANMILSLLNNLENTIMFSKMHLLHPDIITLEELETTIAELKKRYPERTLPISTHSWYDVIKTHSYYYNSKLIIVMDVPILDSETFELYHLYPIPTSNNTILIPPKPLLALNEKYYQYMDSPCEQIEDINICTQQKLQFNPERECIPAFLQGLSAICNPIPIHQPSSLIESINSEYTIIYSKDTTRIRTICNGEPRAQTIQGPVLVQTPLNCSISFRDYNFSHLQNEFKGHPFILPTIDIRFPEKREIPTHKLHIDNIPLDDIHKVYREANAIRLNQLEPTEAPTPFNWNLSIIIIITILILGFVGFKFSKVYKRKTRTTPTVQVNLETQVPLTNPDSALTPSLGASSTHHKLPF